MGRFFVATYIKLLLKAEDKGGLMASPFLMLGRYAMAREFSKAFYNSKEWAQVREAVLMRDKYLCQHCMKPATEVHHIIHLSPENIGDMSIALNMDNLVSLCRDCHFEEHRGEHGTGRAKEEQYEYEFDETGMLVPKKNDQTPV